MKVVSINMILGLGLLMSIMTSCESDTSLDESINVTEIQNLVSTSNWVITYFNDSGKDETYHFNGYEFSFLDNGILEATNGSVVKSGTWSISQDSSDDSNSSGVEFNIHFSNDSGEFEELTDDWEITSRSTSKIELIDVSGGNGGTDYLTFVKM